MHMEPAPPHWTEKAVQGVETAGRVVAAAHTVYNIGRAVGTAARLAAPILGLL